MLVSIPVPAGDLIDRISILRIKKKRIPDRPTRVRIGRELTRLVQIRNAKPALATRKVRQKELLLQAQNQRLWDLEDRLRCLEAKKSFGRSFVATARRVYLTNDKRARLKQEIDLLAGSTLREEKWFSAGDC